MVDKKLTGVKSVTLDEVKAADQGRGIKPTDAQALASDKEKKKQHVKVKGREEI
jgi:hypothetical protein